MYDLIVIGAGASGMIASITASRNGRKVLLLEKLSKLGSKLKATGGGRCNLSNTLNNEEFMKSFGKNGKFMMNALNSFDHTDLIEFFKDIGVETHTPDGFHIFPKSHNSITILNALEDELKNLNVNIKTDQKVISIKQNEVITKNDTFHTKNILIATGGLGYPQLGTTGDGYELAKSLNHKITDLNPAMMPLIVKEEWVSNCRANTIGSATIKISKKLVKTGDLIFTKNGIRGPVVLDFAREITPLLKKNGEVPILVNLTKGMNEDEILKQIKKQNSNLNTLELIETFLPKELSIEICNLAKANRKLSFSKLSGVTRDRLIKTLAWTPLTVIGHNGFDMAMITRGGILLKEINPATMQSKLVQGIYFSGEIVDLDGLCGGYNLQWAFSSGFLVGNSV